MQNQKSTARKRISIFRGAKISHGSTLIMIFLKIITQNPLTQGKRLCIIEFLFPQATPKWCSLSAVQRNTYSRDIPSLVAPFAKSYCLFQRLYNYYATFLPICQAFFKISFLLDKNIIYFSYIGIFCNSTILFCHFCVSATSSLNKISKICFA